MPLGNWNVEWLDHNSERRYPLADTATGIDSSGSFRIPNNFLVELDLPIHSGLNVDPARFFIYKIDAYSVGYAVTVGYSPADESGDIAVASAIVPKASFAGNQENQTFALGGIGDYSDTVGKITVSVLTEIDKQPAGSWQFAFAATQLDPDAVRPIIRGVSSITLINGSQKSKKMYGDITLTAGTNCQLVASEVLGQNATIRINFIKGEGTVEECVCYGDAAPTPPIKTINGIPARNDGAFVFEGIDCLRVTPIANGLRFSDICAQPCCGPTELEVITQDLEKLVLESQRIADFEKELNAAVKAMSMVVLGSRLGDNGCAVT